MVRDKGLVLVVDPDSDVLAEAYSVLTSRGYSVATRASMVEAIKFTTARKPPFVLCSDRMPRFQGESLSRVLRQGSPASRIVPLPARAVSPGSDESVDGYAESLASSLECS